MVLVEDAPRLGDVDVGFLGQRPRQLDQPIEIGAHHAVFAGRLRHALQPPQFLARLILDLLGHFGLGDGLAELGHFRGLAFVAFAELALDRRHLLAQQHFAIARRRATACVSRPISCESRSTSIRCARRRETLVHPRAEVRRLQDFLLLLGRGIHVGRDHVGEHRPATSPTGSPRAVPAAFAAGVAGPRSPVRAGARSAPRCRSTSASPPVSGMRNDAGDKERPAGQELVDPEPLLALTDEMMPAVRRGDVARDIGDGAHAVHVDRQRIGHFRVALHQHADGPLIAHRLLRGEDRARTAERNRQHDAGKQHGRANRHDDERIRRQGRQWRGGRAFRSASVLGESTN